ncbi:hypothetical protein [Devosia sp. Root105]|nr:hypothetical protein [Devosia sp. Root105]
MNVLRFGAYAAAFLLAMTFVAIVTLPDFVTPALLGFIEVFK